ncbi:alpha/beta hydrolase [Nocardia sp. NPDC050710]|uniref:alpha/beta hydrolase n=1 Tax=Nocardia sp. NPDC050710 TaxID=3157220 RepID=UPI0033E846AC
MFNRRKATAGSIGARARWSVVVAATLLVAACGSDTVETPPAPTLDRFYQQKLIWGSCDGFKGGKDLGAAGIECTRVLVPVDYARPDGDTARIALSRSRARGTRVAALLTNPGGPGVPGLGMPLDLAQTPLAERFDLIGMDVRGLGASTPRISCRGAEERLTDRLLLGLSNVFGEIDQVEEEREDYATSCVQQSGIDLIAHVGTVDVARDLDVIRSVLGEAKLSYYGVSYGTRIGSTFAEMFPDRVRAMVLDGAIDPTTNIADQVIDAAAFQHAFDAYAADCAKSATCPLGTDPRRATAAFRSMVLPLIEHPLRTPEGAEIDYDWIMGLTLNSMYHTRFWPTLTQALTAVAQRRGGPISTGEGAEFDNGPDVHNAVLCLEEVRVTDRTTATDLDRRSRAAAPILDDGLAPDQVPLDPCAFWPVPPNFQPHRPTVPGLPKTVVVATTGDPATWYQGGVNLAAALGSALITFEGFQHGATFDGVPCVDEPVVKYLVDLVPPSNIRCTGPAGRPGGSG